MRNGSRRGRSRASRMARCRPGGAISSKKPPPPAPSSLPPWAPVRRAAYTIRPPARRLMPQPSDRFHLPPPMKQAANSSRSPLPAGPAASRRPGHASAAAIDAWRPWRRTGGRGSVGVPRAFRVEDQDALLQLFDHFSAGRAPARRLPNRSGRKRKKCRPPKAAAYWSCRPIGLPSRSISIWQAWLAISSGPTTWPR